MLMRHADIMYSFTKLYISNVALSSISQTAILEVISRHTSSANTFHGIWRVS
jgi:hypothetical protein